MPHLVTFAHDGHVLHGWYWREWDKEKYRGAKWIKINLKREKGGLGNKSYF